PSRPPTTTTLLALTAEANAPARGSSSIKSALVAWGRDASASVNVTPRPAIIATRFFMILSGMLRARHVPHQTVEFFGIVGCPTRGAPQRRRGSEASDERLEARGRS